MWNTVVIKLRLGDKSFRVITTWDRASVAAIETEVLTGFKSFCFVQERRDRPDDED